MWIEYGWADFGKSVAGRRYFCSRHLKEDKWVGGNVFRKPSDVGG